MSACKLSKHSKIRRFSVSQEQHPAIPGPRTHYRRPSAPSFCITWEEWLPMPQFRCVLCHICSLYLVTRCYWWPLGTVFPQFWWRMGFYWLLLQLWGLLQEHCYTQDPWVIDTLEWWVEWVHQSNLINELIFSSQPSTRAQTLLSQAEEPLSATRPQVKWQQCHQQDPLPEESNTSPANHTMFSNWLCLTASLACLPGHT